MQTTVQDGEDTKTTKSQTELKLLQEHAHKTTVCMHKKQVVC